MFSAFRIFSIYFPDTTPWLMTLFLEYVSCLIIIFLYPVPSPHDPPLTSAFFFSSTCIDSLFQPHASLSPREPDMINAFMNKKRSLVQDKSFPDFPELLRQNSNDCRSSLLFHLGFLWFTLLLSYMRCRLPLLSTSIGSWWSIPNLAIDAKYHGWAVII